MKKLAIVTVTFFFAISAIQANAGKNEKSMNKDLRKGTRTERTITHKPGSNGISEMSEESFMNDFPGINHVQWKINGTFDQALFMKNGKQMSAYYDDEGNLVGSTTEAKFSDLPSKGQKEINSRYKDYKIGPIVYFDDNEDNITDLVLYGMQLHGPDSWLVELSNSSERIVVQAFKDGQVSYFTKM
jgi:hypothetical protein